MSQLKVDSTILASLDGNNNPIQVFTMGLGIDEALAMRSGAGTDRYFHADALGSIRALTSAGGSGVESLEYLSYGKAVARDSSGNQIELEARESALLYTGKLFDDETKLQHSNNRALDNTAGFFVSEDPLGILTGPNVYLYVNNNPIMGTDPLGLIRDDPGQTLYFANDQTQYDPNQVIYDMSNFSAGYGDFISGGIAGDMRSLIGADAGVDMCTVSYQSGRRAGMAHAIIDALLGGLSAGARLASRGGSLGKALNQNRYVRLGASGANRAPTLRIGNKPPTKWNHIDLTFFGL